MRKLQDRSRQSSKRSTEQAQRKTTQGQPNKDQGINESKHHRKNKSQFVQTDLPPNENILKDADEVYGDTEIRPDKGRA